MNSRAGRVRLANDVLRNASVLSALGATALGTMGQFREAGALVLGTVLAIFSAHRLSDTVERLSASADLVAASGKATAKFAAFLMLRYLLLGAGLYLGAKAFSSEISWLLAGLSSVVLALGLRGALEFRAAAPGTGDGTPRAEES